MRILAILAVFFAFCFGASLSELKSNCANDSRMCANLGDYYYNNKDFFSAKDYYEIACNAKDSYACYSLGYLYEKGLGTRQNLSKAFEFHNQACVFGSQYGCEYVVEQGKKGCQNGISKACSFVASIYEYWLNGDENTILYYLRQGCNLNDYEACKELQNKEQAKVEKQRQERLEQERRERERLEAQREQEIVKKRQEEQDKFYQEQERESQYKTKYYSHYDEAKENAKIKSIMAGVIVFFILISGIISWIRSCFTNSSPNFDDESSNSQKNQSNNQNSTYSNTNESEYKGFFTTQEASYIVQILAKLIISDGEIDTKEVLTLGAFINFVANDDEKQAEILLDIFTKALTSNISPYKTVFFYKQKFNPNRAEMTYIIFLFLHMAYSDGEFSHHEKAIFDEIFKGFGISDDEKARIYDYFYKQYGHKYRSRSREKFDDDFDGEYDSDESYCSDEPDPYEVLGLSKDATFDEVKKRYRKLASQNHPDRFANASNEEIAASTKRMQEINTAYEKIKKEMGK